MWLQTKLSLRSQIMQQKSASPLLHRDASSQAAAGQSHFRARIVIMLFGAAAVAVTLASVGQSAGRVAAAAVAAASPVPSLNPMLPAPQLQPTWQVDLARPQPDSRRLLLQLIKQGNFEAARRQLQEVRPPPVQPTVSPPPRPPPPRPPGPDLPALEPAPALPAVTGVPECVKTEVGQQYMTGSKNGDLAFCLCLLCLSGLFSGLTLGLMSLTCDELEIYIESEKPDPSADDYKERMDEAHYAVKILPLRRRGNLLLCTLLLGNTLVNALIAILSASFTGGQVGALVSVFARALVSRPCLHRLNLPWSRT